MAAQEIVGGQLPARMLSLRTGGVLPPDRDTRFRDRTVAAR